MALLTRNPALENPGHERAWLLRLTINRCKDRLRFRFQALYPDGVLADCRLKGLTLDEAAALLSL